MTKDKDRRKHLRLEHKAKIQASGGSEAIVAYTKNLSDHGLFIMGQFIDQPKLGDRLEVLLLDFDGAIARPVIVRRIEPGVGLGVEFLEE